MAAGCFLASTASAEVTETAVYRVRFDATWSAQSHPVDIPSNPHFSALIGGVHSGRVQVWHPGDLASDGIEDMAERGRTTPLDLEVQAAIDAGDALQIISGGGIGTSPGGSSQAFFTVSRDFPLVSLVSMLAPSPDWFVGVYDLNLLAPSDWLEEKKVTLYAWDAGTDSGPTYTSPNEDTSPAEPIRQITSGPAGGNPVGTFTFTRQDEAEPDALTLLDGRFRVSAEWQNFDLERGRARAMNLTNQSGYLWFFGSGNIELVIKVLDGCQSNGRFWVFSGGLTSTGVELRVEDTETGQVNVYANNLGDPFQPIQDTDAFATCP